MKVAEAPKSTTAANRVQAKQQPFFQKEGQGSFFSKPKEATPSFFNPTTVQPKLKIGKPNDKYEVQADAMADKVVQKMAQPSQNKTAEDTSAEQLQKKEVEEEVVQNKLEIQRKPIFESNGEQPEANVQAKFINTPSIQKQAPEGEEELQKKEEISESEEEVQTMSMAGGASGAADEESSIQRQSDTSAQATPDLQSQLNSSKGGGSPLPPETQSSMGSAMGADFSGVKTHTGNEAVQMNKDLGAQAFTHGNDIYFNEGKYNTNSTAGQHLLAHELTHTVQQGASKPTVQKAEALETATAEAALRPNDPLDISHRFELTNAWTKYLDQQHAKGKREFQVDVKIGNRYSGTIEVTKIRSTSEGKVAKYELATGSLKHYLDISGWNFLNPMRQAGIDPILVLTPFDDAQKTNGFLSIKSKNIPVLGDTSGFISSLNNKLSDLGLLGIEKLKIPKGGIENKFENGRLVFQVSTMSTVVDGFLKAGGGLGITGDVFTFNLNTDVDVAGLAQGQFMITRNQDGKLGGKGTIQANIANVQATIMAEYIDGVVTIQGTGQIASEKFTGSITLLVTDAVRSKQMMHAALGTEVMEGEKQAAVAATPKKQVVKTPNNQVLAGWGEVQAAITPWLQGAAKVGIDHEGHITIVGNVAVPNEVELMEERGKKQDLFKVELRAGYGIPLVGQVFLFANIGMFVNAGFGPLVLKDVGFTGTYSTDPKVLQNFNITGTLGINAFAILGLEAEAGVGLTLLGHDVKAGVNLTAAAGLRAYAEATPTFEYKEKENPEGGKIGESHLKGHFEAAAQLFLQLSGALFYELDSPWWSPAPDGREETPLGEVQYPIGDSMGIGADIDWLVGSPDAPELTFSPVDFDPSKFTKDVMADPPPRKMGKADANPEGKWTGEPGSGQKKDAAITGEGKGLPANNKKKEDLKKLPDQQKYMRALDEMSKLEKVKPKPTHSVVAAKAKKVKAKYGLEQIQVRGGANADKAAIYVKHKKENNGKHLLKIPLMSLAEAIKLRHAAMADLRSREKKAAAQDGSMEESAAASLITAWKKAHPIVESAKVVDGKATWDYFIDFGDVSNTEKGKLKGGQANENVADKIKQENKGVKPEPITDADRKQHESIAQKIAEELQKLKGVVEDESFEKFYSRLKSEGKRLENQYQPQLKEGINLDVLFTPLVKDKKDNDLDIHIKIAPNDTDKDLSLDYEGTIDEFIAFRKESEGKGFTFEEIMSKIKALRVKTDTSITIKRVFLKDTDHNNWELDITNKKTGEVATVDIIRSGGKSKLPEETLERLIKRLKTELASDASKMKRLNLAEKKLNQMMSLTDRPKPVTSIETVGPLLTEIENILLELVETVTGYPKPEYQISNGKANEVEVDNLSPNRVMGQKPFSSPLGWGHLQDKSLTKGGGNFVRMHLINMKFGGSGTTGNLVSGAEKYNSQTENKFDSRIKAKIGSQPINSAKPNPQYNNVVWIKVKVNYFSGDKFPVSNSSPVVNGEIAQPNWFAKSVEFTSGDYEQIEGKWNKKSATTLKDTLHMDLPQWDAATNLSLRFANRKQLIAVAGNADDITPLNMRILRGLRFSNTEELKTAVDNYMDSNDLKSEEQRLEEEQLNSLFKFSRLMIKLIGDSTIKLNV